MHDSACCSDCSLNTNSGRAKLRRGDEVPEIRGHGRMKRVSSEAAGRALFREMMANGSVITYRPKPTGK